MENETAFKIVFWAFTAMMFVFSAGILLLLQQIYHITLHKIKDENPDLLFFISLVSLISWVMIFTEKEKLLAFDYKSRMIATGFAFLLGTLFLNSPYYIILVFLIFSSVFLLKSFSKIES